MTSVQGRTKTAGGYRSRSEYRAGVAAVIRAGYGDPSARDPKSKYYDEKATEEDPRWYMVDIEFRERFPAVVPLQTLKETPGLETMVVTTKSRLSVQPVTEEEFRIVRDLGRGGG